MKKRTSFLRSFVVLAIFILVLSPLSVFAEKHDDTTINYVALGDSLAKGMDSDGDPTTEKGYPYYIEQLLKESRYEVNYENFGQNAYTTSNVLKDLQSKPELTEKLANANLITISAGANDLLGAIGNIDEIDFGNEEEMINLEKRVGEVIELVGENTADIITYINRINPEAHIYVMGYYNAMPYLPSSLQEQLVPMLQGLNGAIATPTKMLGATFVPTFDIFEGNYNEFLPNPNNIHPSEVGYRALANGFMDYIRIDYPILNENLVVQLGEEVTVLGGDQLQIGNTTLLFPSDLPNGTTITVTKTDDKLFTNLTDLLKVGDVLNFDVEFPEGQEHYEGKFQLTMTISNHDHEKFDIFYYNVEQELWEAQQATIDLNKNIATAEVSHFSSYGIFASIVSEDIDEEKNGDKEEPVDRGESEKVEDEEGNEDKKDKEASVSENEGERLPDTALHHYTWIAIGGVLFLIGVVLLFRKRQYV